MTYGIELFTPSGVKFFSTESTTWNFVGSFIAPANESADRTYNVLSLIGEVIMQRSFIGGVPDNQEAYIHNVSRSSNVITASSGNVATLIVVLAR